MLSYLDLATNSDQVLRFNYTDKKLTIDVPRCRICLEDIDVLKELDDIVSPCHCSGSMSLVHIKCFNQQKNDRCQICKFKMKLLDRNTVEKLKNLQGDLSNILHQIQEPEEEPHDILHEPHFIPHIPHIPHVANVPNQIPFIPGLRVGQQLPEMQFVQLGNLENGVFPFVEIVMNMCPLNGYERELLKNSIRTAKNCLINNNMFQFYYWVYLFTSGLAFTKAYLLMTIILHTCLYTVAMSMGLLKISTLELYRCTKNCIIRIHALMSHKVVVDQNVVDQNVADQNVAG